jgi:hypothetical protein
LADNALAFVKDYPWLWQVSAVSAPTCSVQMVDESGDPVVATEITGILYDVLPEVGDNVLLCRRTSGALGIFLGGVASYTATMLKAKAAMTADDTAYACVLLEADGTEGSAITARRPNGVAVNSGDIGFLAFDTSAQAMFIPANMRAVASMPLVVETRTSDPGSPATGRIWMRTDL